MRYAWNSRESSRRSAPPLSRPRPRLLPLARPPLTPPSLQRLPLRPLLALPLLLLLIRLHRPAPSPTDNPRAVKSRNRHLLRPFRADLLPSALARYAAVSRLDLSLCSRISDAALAALSAAPSLYAADIPPRRHRRLERWGSQERFAFYVLSANLNSYLTGPARGGERGGGIGHQRLERRLPAAAADGRGPGRLVARPLPHHPTRITALHPGEKKGGNDIREKLPSPSPSPPPLGIAANIRWEKKRGSDIREKL